MHNPSINKNEVIVKAIIDLGLNGTVLFHPALPTGQIFSNAAYYGLLYVLMKSDVLVPALLVGRPPWSSDP